MNGTHVSNGNFPDQRPTTVPAVLDVLSDETPIRTGYVFIVRNL